MKLTIRTIALLNPQQADVFAWDDEVAGFGIRIKPSGVKSFLLQYRNASGNSRRLTIGKLGVLTPEEARKLAKEKLAEVAKGLDPAEARIEQRKAMTVAELCEAYLAAAEKNLIMGKRGLPKKQSTLLSDNGRINGHILPLLGNKKVRDVTTPDVIRFMREVASGKTASDTKTGFRGRSIIEGGAGVSSRTVGLLGGIFTYAVSEGIIQFNPVRGVKRPADQRRNIRLTNAQYTELGKTLNTALHDGLNVSAIMAVRLIALTGCRRGEIERLRWDDVDISGKCLRLSDSKEGSSTRPIGSPVIALLSELLKAKQAHDKKHQKLPGFKPNSYVLPGIAGEQWFTGLTKAWLRIRSKGRLPAKLTMHGLRHGFASIASDLGYSEPTIAAMIGHSMHSITGRYIHHLDDALIAAADRVSSHISMAIEGKVGAEILPLMQAL